MHRPGSRARVSPISTRARPSRPRGRRSLSVRPWRPSTVAPDGPRCPLRSASATTRNHQAVGATRRPSCFCRQVQHGRPWKPRPRSQTSPKAADTRGVSGDVRHPASRRDRDHPRTTCGRTSRCCNDGSGSMTELFFSEQLDDIAAAKAFCGGCPVRDECLDGARRAARAVGRVGRRAVRARKGRRPEAQAGPPAEGAPRRARGAKRLISSPPQ